MPIELRFDAGRLGRVTRNAQGGARIPASTTRTGILEYRRADGSVQREYRPADEVFRADSLAEMAGLTVTDRHVMVDPSNWRELARGHVVGPGRQDGEYVAAELDVQDADTLARVDSGDLAEVSMGYRVDYDHTPGVHNGQRYDGVQRNIRYNHVALLPRGGGRAGRDVGLRLDSNSAVCDTDLIGLVPEIPMSDKPKILIRLDGRDVEQYGPEHVAYLEGQIKAEKTRADQAEARADATKTELDQTKVKLTAAEDPKRLDGLVKASVELRTKAARVLGPDAKFDGKSDREIMVECVKLDAKDFTDKDKSNDYVEARFDAVVVKDVRVDGIGALPGVLADLKDNGRSAGIERGDSVEREDGELDADAAEAAFMNSSRNGWKQAK